MNIFLIPKFRCIFVFLEMHLTPALATSSIPLHGIKISLLCSTFVSCDDPNAKLVGKTSHTNLHAGICGQSWIKLKPMCSVQTKMSSLIMSGKSFDLQNMKPSTIVKITMLNKIIFR